MTATGLGSEPNMTSFAQWCRAPLELDRDIEYRQSWRGSAGAWRRYACLDVPLFTVCARVGTGGHRVAVPSCVNVLRTSERGDLAERGLLARFFGVIRDGRATGARTRMPSTPHVLSLASSSARRAVAHDGGTDIQAFAI